jgi:pyrroline-5-carboxylate reductase
MELLKIGFIGGGRVAKIILKGWSRVGKLPTKIIVSDTNADVLNKLKNEFQHIETVVNNAKLPASCDIVLIGLHPPVVGDILQEIKSVVNPSTIVISLAPKVSIAKLSEGLGGLKNIARINPNAPSIVNAGYNPVSFSTTISEEGRKIVLELFGLLGDCPEVPEELLESFTITTAMGPTYLWFQLYELQELAKSFGISANTLKDAIPKMLNGAVKTMYESGLTSAEVMDLVPVRPLGEEEATIKGFYQNRLNALYKKLKS